MKRIASLLMLAARSTLWKAAGITLASCLTEAGLFLAALSGLAGHRPHRLLRILQPHGYGAC